MKKIVFFIIGILTILYITINIYTTKSTIKEYINHTAKEIYQNRTIEFNYRTNEKKLFLKDLASYIANSETVIDAYLQNDREKLIKFAKPIYDNFHKDGLIEELHFFKRPAISFVNFADLKHFNIDVSNIRKDILWINSSFTPSVHEYICRMYPGLRATYPIIYKDRLLGSLSFGINLEQLYKKSFTTSTTDVTIYYNDERLKQFLLPQKYQKYKNLPLYKGYRVDGKLYEIKLEKGYEITDNYDIISKFPIKDFFEKTIAYVAIVDHKKEDISLLESSIYQKLYIHILFALIFITIIISLFIYIFKNVHKLYEIMEIIENKKFNELPPKSSKKDEMSLLKNRILDMAKNLQTYLELLQNKIEDFQSKAYMDSLTSAFNRRVLQEYGDKLFLKYKLANVPVGIIMLDIDDFKKINDTYGHDVGDLVLMNLAKTIKRLIRKGDIFIRYGGEEFLIILPNTSLDQAYRVAQKINTEVANQLLNIKDNVIKYTVSVGVSSINYETDLSLNDAIKRADEKLYEAKRTGKNKVVI